MKTTSIWFNKINKAGFILGSLVLPAVLFLNGTVSFARSANDSLIDKKFISAVRQELSAKFTGAQEERIMKGTEQLAAAWQPADGSSDDYKKFCIDNFIPETDLKENFSRISQDIVSLNGNINRVRELINEPSSFTDVKELQADAFFRKSIPNVDAFKSKLAQFVILNFPYYSLSEKRKQGAAWTKEKWAMVRLGDMYANRRTGTARSPYGQKERDFKFYMEHYFIRMQDVCMPDGTYPFTTATVLHSHRGLRDEVKDEYTDPGGTKKQALIGKVVEHILLGTIPAQFRQDTTTRWNPWTNELFRANGSKKEKIKSAPEGVTRYQGLLDIFKNKSFQDPFLAKGSTYIVRNFENNNLTIEEAESLIRNFLKDPIFAAAGSLIEKQLKRPLQPFDIWYSGFQDQSLFSASMLDSMVRHRYPTPAAFQNDLPQILNKIGFSAEEGKRLGARIKVRPVPSGGYTMRPSLPDDPAVMTTMFEVGGMDYKGYRVAIHELGHAVEMLYTADGNPNYLLGDVPSNGITEGVAEFFAYRNIRGLSLSADPQMQQHMQALATLWYLYEMGGQALTDIETWKWMYAHPDATSEELRSAVLSSTATIWNTYFAPVFKIKDQHLLSIYNHYITGDLYLYNYFYSNVIMFQLYDSFGKTDLQARLSAACSEGNTLPDLWMQHAVGTPVSITPLMSACRKAIDFFNDKLSKN